MNVDLSLLDWVLFAVAGVGTGVINTLAGSGSLITLPIFIFVCGLPAPVANGTNRIGVMVQSMVGMSEMSRRGITEFAGSWWVVLPAVIGAAVGSRIAVGIDEQTMNYTIGGLMVFMLIVLLVNPKRWLIPHGEVLSGRARWLAAPVFFAIGVYGGFIQAGVGVFLLAGLVLIGRFTLSAANGIKLLVVAAYGLPTLLIFFLQDQVHWGYGLAMAVFQSIGAWLAVRFVAQVPDADRWIHRLLILTVAGSAVLFFV
ncbi:MAG: sulfite exporter TauE/SafE family protein [Rhodothermales bacterium]|nr:sulfite exporter TauE/SafE family protein [Rhodothermales bacterium]MBO6778172.1 sulfite exporter TauE/SafE family protein [Rhodothermales bacterium]